MKSRYGLQIRAATNMDAQGSNDLLLAAGYSASTPVSVKRLNAVRQESGAILIAAEWEPPIGLVAMHWYQTLGADQPRAQITTLLVAPSERRWGIGRLLVKAAAQTARLAGCSALELMTNLDDQDLLDFCSASGFTEAGQRLVRPLRKKG